MLLALLAITAWVYWPGTAGGLILDDPANLEKIRPYGEGYVPWYRVVEIRRSDLPGSLPYRPLSLLSLAADWRLGNGTMRIFKEHDVLLHLLAGVLVAWLALRLYRQGAPAGSTVPAWLAVGVAAAWLLAPLHVSTVLYLIQRMAQLATLFSLAAILCYVLARQQPVSRPGRSAALLVLALGLFLPLAAASKENAATLPLLLLVVELSFFRFRGPPALSRLLRLGHGAVALVTVAGILLLVARPDAGPLASYAWRGFGLGERLMTEARVLWSYLGSLVLPRGQAMGVYHDDYVVSTGLLSPPATLLALGGWAAALVVAWRLRRAAPYLAFGLGFYLLGHLAESTILPLEIYFEHRNYLPSFGIFYAAGAGLWHLARATGTGRLLAAGATAVVALYAVGTFQRVQVWADPELLLMSSARAHPDSARVRVDLASYHAARGDLRSADADLDELVRLAPEFAAGAALHRMLMRCGTEAAIPETAWEELARVPRVVQNTYTASTLHALLNTLKSGRCDQLDEPRLARLVAERRVPLAQTLNADRAWSIRFVLARLYLRNRQPGAALTMADEALVLRPNSFNSARLRLEALISLGRFDEAARQYADLKARNSRLVDAQQLAPFAALFEERPGRGGTPRRGSG